MPRLERDEVGQCLQAAFVSARSVRPWAAWAGHGWSQLVMVAAGDGGHGCWRWWPWLAMVAMARAQETRKVVVSHLPSQPMTTKRRAAKRCPMWSAIWPRDALSRKKLLSSCKKLPMRGCQAQLRLNSGRGGHALINGREK
jgi:hypothetical protein